MPLSTGEAQSKNDKANEYVNGLPTSIPHLTKIERGIVTSSCDVFFPTNSDPVITPISAERLRFQLLYWDKISVVESNIARVDNTPEIILLEQADVVSRTYVAVETDSFIGYGRNSLNAYFHIEAVIKHAIRHSDQNPGQWTIQRNKSGMLMDSMDMAGINLPAVELEIIANLPAPFGNVPINEILEFKTKHSSEIDALRMSLDEMYQAIATSNDVPRAKSAQILKLEVAIKDLNKSAKESFSSSSLQKLRVSVKLDVDSVKNGIIAGILAPGPIIVQLGVAAATALVFKLVSATKVHTGQNSGLDLSYLVELKKENIAR